MEGAFTKAFRSGLQPVEIGRRLVREMEAGRTLGVRGTIAPNQFFIYISQIDHEAFEAFEAALARELGDAAREYAREEGYKFLGPVIAEIVPDSTLKRGALDIEARITGAEGGLVGTLFLGDGRRISLSNHPVALGRAPECDIPLDDEEASRRHAEVIPTSEGYRLVDLGSTNGTTVNNVAIQEHELEDGDEIAIGTTIIRFETS